MSPVRIEDFGGLVPRLNAWALPPNAAQVAEDCDLTGGVLAPLDAKGPFTKMWKENAAGDIVQDGDRDSLIRMDKPNRITFDDDDDSFAFSPQYWIRSQTAWIVDEVNQGVPTFAVLSRQDSDWWGDDPNDNPGTQSIQRDTGGFVATKADQTLSGTARRLETTNFYGPFIRMAFRGQGQGNTNGGPAEYLDGPGDAASGNLGDPEFRTNNLSISSPRFPNVAIPLFYRGRYYALARIDPSTYEAADFSRTLPDGVFETWPLPANWSLRFDLTPVYPVNRRVRFAATFLKTYIIDGEEIELEGPLSEPSEIWGSNPLRRLRLNIEKNSFYDKIRVYVADEEDGVYRLHGEQDAGESNRYFALLTEEGVEAPFNGNYPPDFETNSDTGEETFLEGFITHPAGFGVGRHQRKVWVSDFFRFHAWPEEWSVEFTENVVAIGLVGRTVIVWTLNRVFAFTGQNPATFAQSSVLLSDSYRLLPNTKGSICRLGGALVYASDDGLMRVSGSSIENLTRGFYTREEWLALGPTNMKCEVADNSIFATFESGAKLRFDVEEQLKAITTFTGTPDAATGHISASTLRWKSKVFRFEQPVRMEHVAVLADAEATVTLWADGVEVSPTISITDHLPEEISNSTFAEEWEVQVECSGVVRRVELFERQYLEFSGNQPIRLTPENVARWESVWLRFPSPLKIAALMVNDQGSSINANGVLVTLDSPNNSPEVRRVGEDRGIVQIRRALTASDVWQIKIAREDNERVESLTIYPWMSIPMDGDVARMINQGGDMPPWYYSRFVFDAQNKPASALAFFDDAGVSTGQISVHVDDSNSAAINNATIRDGEEIILDDAPFGNSFSVDVNDDLSIREVYVFPREVIPVNDSGVIVRSAGQINAWRNKVLQFPISGSWAVVRVVADDYTDVVARLLLKNSQSEWAEAWSGSPSSSEEMVLPHHFPVAREWRLDIQKPNIPLDEVHLIPRREVNPHNGVVVIRRTSEPFSWRRWRIVSPRPFSPSVFRVLSEEYDGMQLDLYSPDTGQTFSSLVRSEQAIRIRKMTPRRTWVMDVTGVPTNRILEVGIASSPGALSNA